MRMSCSSSRHFNILKYKYKSIFKGRGTHISTALNKFTFSMQINSKDFHTLEDIAIKHFEAIDRICSTSTSPLREATIFIATFVLGFVVFKL